MATPSSIRRIAASPSLLSQCPPPTLLRANSTTPPVRHLTTTSPHRSSTAPYTSSDPDAASTAPRWQSTPRGMSMPFRVRPTNKNNEWRVNSDPRKLNEFYNRLLGEGGEAMLSEEAKWLAITHKSFDQGRRGFNDRLSWFGKRVLSMHTSLALLSSPPTPSLLQTPAGAESRQPYEHPLLESLPNLSSTTHSHVLGKSRLSQLGKEAGLQGVLRWKPKKVDNLSGSGLELVTAQAIYAIVGAVALERGSEVAKRVARERILKPLGLEGRDLS